jgi:hypothetical protein
VRGAVLVVALAVVGVAPAVPAGAVPGGAVVADPVCVGEAGTAGDAAVLAAVCDVPVEVVAERTAWSSTFALPDGSVRLDSSMAAVRTDVSGVWEPVDPSLVVTGDGVQVVSAVVPMVFSDGSDGMPLVRVERDGHEVVFDAPFELTEPVVEGARVTYPAVLPGVDLVVSVNEDATGFSQVLRVESAQAAANPALAELTFDVVTSEGVRLEERDGGFAVADAAGGAVLTSPAPTMWDSGHADGTARGTTPPGAFGAGAHDVDPTLAPPPGAAVEVMASELRGDAVTVVPDADLLSDPATTWPVFIDPGMSGSLNQRTAVRTVIGNAYNFAGDEGVGLCNKATSDTCSHTFKSRVLYQFAGLAGLGALEPDDVQSAVFAVTGTHSYSCTPMPVTLYAVADFDQSTPYPGGPQWDALQTQTITHRSGCGAGREPRRIEFDATAQARAVAAANTSLASFGLAADEGSMASWKRYAWDASFSITYNRAPTAPTNVRTTDPDTTCTVGAGRPYVRSLRPTLRAVLADPDGGNVAGYVEVIDLGTGGRVWGPAVLPGQGSGAEHAVQVPAGVLADGRSYRWSIRGDDGQRSGPTVSCELTVDTTAPVVPGVTGVAGTGLVVYPESPVAAGGLGVEGRFTFTNGGSSDVEYYRYTFLGQPQRTVPEGAATVRFVPTEVGSQTLTVESIDRAGNVSPARVYRFTVGFPALSDAWQLDEAAGSVAANVNGAAQPLAVSSSTTRTAGLGAMYDYPDDRALQFDALTDVARTAGPVVRSDGSYAVMATVRLDDVGGTYTAVSQSGAQTSGFELGHRVDAACPAGTGGHCWALWATGSDVASASPVVVRSAVPARPGSWVQLTGMRNAGTGTLELAVCEYGTPDDALTPRPVSAAPVAAPTAWTAAGPLQVGRGGTLAAPARGWHGAVGQVRTYTGPLPVEKLRVSCTNPLSITPTLDPPPVTQPGTPPPPMPLVKPGQPGFEPAFVASLYRDLLGREASYRELVVWTSARRSGASLQQVVEGIVNSQEWRNRVVNQKYQLFLGRNADSSGLQGWVNALNQGSDVFVVEKGIVGSAEYYARAGGTATGYVTALFRDLLGRSPSAAELSSWAGRVGTDGALAVAHGVVYSPEHVNRVIDQSYRQTLGRAVDSAGQQTWSTYMWSGGTVAGLLARITTGAEYTNNRVRIG